MAYHRIDLYGNLVYVDSYQRVTLSGSIVSGEAASGTTRSLIANPLGVSATSSPAMATDRAIQAAVLGESQVSSAVISLSRGLIATVPGVSVTSALAAFLGRDLLAVVSASSATPAILATAVRELLANLVGASTAPVATVTLARELLANLTGASITPDILITVIALIQHSYRWVNDDGSESDSTFAAGTNVGVTLQPDTIKRLRFLVDSTGDTTGTSYRLEYRKKPSGGDWGDWIKVIN